MLTPEDKETQILFAASAIFPGLVTTRLVPLSITESVL
jgi:hypothetical protein